MRYFRDKSYSTPVDTITMETFDLKDFERHTAVRSLRIEDYDALVAMHLKCFPGLQPWSKAQIESQLQIFPEGPDLHRDRWRIGGVFELVDHRIRPRCRVPQLARCLG